MVAKYADRALVQLVDERPVVGARALTLLVRPGEVKIGLAGEEIEPPRERLRIAANKGVYVIARQVPIPGEESEYLYIAFGRARDGCLAIVDNRLARPS